MGESGREGKKGRKSLKTSEERDSWVKRRTECKEKERGNVQQTEARAGSKCQKEEEGKFAHRFAVHQ